MKKGGRFHYDWSLIQQDVTSGLSEREITKKYGVSSASIFNAKKRGSLKTRSSTESRKFRVSLGLSKYPKHTKESKAKLSKKMIGNKNGKHQISKNNWYKNIKMDSTWEVATAMFLDESGVIWSYEQEFFKLSGNRSYRPDFFIYDIQGNFIKIIEVKGYWRKENKIKFEEFLKKYPSILVEVWDKKILTNLGLLNSNGYAKYIVGTVGETGTLRSAKSA